MGTLSSITAITNIIVLPTSQHDMACCKEISAAACGAALLGIVQIGVQWTCFMAIMILFLAFFPSESDQQPRSSDGNDVELPRKRDAIIVGCASLCTLLFCGIGSLIFLVRAPVLLLGWANFLGICSSILACIQYLPQLWTTWKIKRVLSLSVVTMLIQVPGAVLFAFSLFLRVGWQGWSSWLVYLVTAVLQGCLLGMAIRFWMLEKREKEAEQNTSQTEPVETDPLLRPRFQTVRSSHQSINGTVKNNPIGMLYSATPPGDGSVLSDPGTSPDDTRE